MHQSCQIYSILALVNLSDGLRSSPTCFCQVRIVAPISVQLWRSFVLAVRHNPQYMLEVDDRLGDFLVFWEVPFGCSTYDDAGIAGVTWLNLVILVKILPGRLDMILPLGVVGSAEKW